MTAYRRPGRVRAVAIIGCVYGDNIAKEVEVPLWITIEVARDYFDLNVDGDAREDEAH